MTVSELIDQLKDCAPNAEAYVLIVLATGEVFKNRIESVQSDGERVVLS